MLELRSMLLKIAECLLLCVKGRRKSAHLPVGAERDEESDGSIFRFGSAHELHSPERGRFDERDDAKDKLSCRFS